MAPSQIRNLSKIVKEQKNPRAISDWDDEYDVGDDEHDLPSSRRDANLQTSNENNKNKKTHSHQSVSHPKSSNATKNSSL